eukprot:TRINITY_DN11122_c0_g1_i2.p1 TRINITY_DN11122_c0_g1~~TRINITY_DN11122_c0_g1_i2.p1  ORF type:complete len:199 (+),score=18.40 TRINITY_DN11122_c0_g1_i2:196-792(+)
MGTRTATQVRSHAQKYLAKQAQLGITAESEAEGPHSELTEKSKKCYKEIDDSQTYSQTPCVSPLIKQQCAYKGPEADLPALEEQEMVGGEYHLEESKAPLSARKRKAPLPRQRFGLAVKSANRPRIRRRQAAPERLPLGQEFSCDSSYCQCLEPELDLEFENFELDSSIRETIPIISLENSDFWNDSDSHLPAFLNYS